MEEYRIDNIGLKQSYTIKINNGQQKLYWEIVYYYPNSYYGKINEYEEVDSFHNIYVKKGTRGSGVQMHKSCFERKESNYTICVFGDINKDEAPDCRIIGSRLTDLPSTEIANCIIVIKEFYRQWNKYYEERRFN